MRVSGSYANGTVTTPKSGHGRVVPMILAVAVALSRLSQRGWWVGDDELVFAGEFGTYLDGSALRRPARGCLRDPTADSSHFCPGSRARLVSQHA